MNPESSATPGAYRVRPNAAVALVIVVAYAAVLIAMQKLSGVPYNRIASSADHLLEGVLIPVAIGSTLLTVVAHWTGWWKDIWRDPHRITAYRWMWLFPIVIAVQIALNLTQSKFGTLSTAFVIYAVIATMLVGYSEELLIRGLFIRGVRGSGASEIGVFFASSITFGLLHGINVLNGQSVKTTVTQVILTAVFGGAMYIAIPRLRTRKPAAVPAVSV